MADLTAVKAELTAQWASLGPERVCRHLGIQGRKEGRSYIIKCLWHAESDGSCSVQLGQSGTIRAHCFACDQSWDVHAMIAQQEHLSLHGQDFVTILKRECEMLSRYDLMKMIDGDPDAKPDPNRPPTPPLVQLPDRDYPPGDEIAAVWDGCISVLEDKPTSDWLWLQRGLVAYEISVLGLVRALPPDMRKIEISGEAGGPRWMNKRVGDRLMSWPALDHRLITPLYDHQGVMRSLRARYVGTDTEHQPKSLTPSGYRSSGVVMADALALATLRGAVGAILPENQVLRVGVCEGEPDWLQWALRVRSDLETRPVAVFGIESGAWTSEIASTIPDGSIVIIRTHHDEAGDRYALKIAQDLQGRCELRRRKRPA